MSQPAFSWELFHQTPIVGIVRHLSSEDVAYLLPIYQKAGLTTIEVTMNTPGAEAILQRALRQFPTGLNIGAGTVCTEDDLDRALAAGAQFIVTPIVRKKIIRACVDRNVPIFPGAFTPSEIYKAWSLGASMVKVFPTTTLGPSYIKDVKAPLPQIKLLPTGGITVSNMVDFLRAGADGLGIGSHLFEKTLIQKRDTSALNAHFSEFTKLLANRSD